MSASLPAVPEPPKDRSLESLHPAMRDVVLHILTTLRAAGQPFAPGETFRTEARQAWLYAAGRTRPGEDASPKRPLGSTITQKDGAPGVWPADHPVVSERGKTRRSRHQSGLAVDLYPLDPAGHSFSPPAKHPCWERLATVARSLGLRAGRDWKDSPHVEWRGPLPAETRKAAHESAGQHMGPQAPLESTPATARPSLPGEEKA